MGVAHEMLLSTSAETLEGDGNPRCQLRRGENTRILFVFNEARPFPFHILVPSKSYSPAAEAPTVAFITEYGRRVFPFVEHSTKGGGFKLLCMHKNVVCAYVDCHEGDSPLGVSQIMKKFNVQTHSEAELKVSTDPGGKKAGAKRKKKGQQEGPAKKSRESDTEGQLAEKNTILPFTRKQAKMGEARTTEDEQEKEGSDIEIGGTEKSSEEKEIEGEIEDGTCSVKQKTSNISYNTSHNTRYGLRNRSILTSAAEPSPVKTEHSPVPCEDDHPKETEEHFNKDASLDSGKAASQDIVDSSPLQGLDAEDKISAAASQAESESIFCSTPMQPKSAASTSHLTPMQMLVAHLPNEDVDLQGYLSQQVDPEASVEVPDICVISNVEEEDDVVEVKSKLRRGKRRAAAEQDPKKLLAGKSSVSELTRPQLLKWMQANKRLIVLLFQGKEYSRRHDDFLSGSKKRAALQHQVDLRLFTHHQIQIIGKALMDIFCAKGMQYFGYVMSVLFPECLIRIIADFYQVDFKKAEEMMFNPALVTKHPKESTNV